MILVSSEKGFFEISHAKKQWRINSKIIAVKYKQSSEARTKRSLGTTGMLSDLRNDLKAGNPQATFNTPQICTPRSDDSVLCARWINKEWQQCPNAHVAVSEFMGKHVDTPRSSMADCSCPFDSTGQVVHATFILRDERRSCRITEVNTVCNSYTVL